MPNKEYDLRKEFWNGPTTLWGTYTQSFTYDTNGINLDIGSGGAAEIIHKEKLKYHSKNDATIRATFRMKVDYYSYLYLGFVRIENGRHSGMVRGRILINGETVYTNQSHIENEGDWEFSINKNKSYQIKRNNILLKSGTLNNMPVSKDYSLELEGGYTSGPFYLKRLEYESGYDNKTLFYTQGKIKTYDNSRWVEIDSSYLDLSMFKENGIERLNNIIGHSDKEMSHAMSAFGDTMKRTSVDLNRLKDIKSLKIRANPV